jgi:hypothetical protein
LVTILGKDERTREFIFEALKNVQKAFTDEGLVANLRLETYEGKNYFHVPPPIDE